MLRHKWENYNFNSNFFPLRCLSHKSAKNNDKVNDPDRQGLQSEKNNCSREDEVRVTDKQL